MKILRLVPRTRAVELSGPSSSALDASARPASLSRNRSDRHVRCAYVHHGMEKGRSHVGICRS